LGKKKKDDDDDDDLIWRGVIHCIRDKQKQAKFVLLNLVGRDHIADQGIEEIIFKKKDNHEMHFENVNWIKIAQNRF
jgi:hypothetical protein